MLSPVFGQPATGVLVSASSPHEMPAGPADFRPAVPPQPSVPLPPACPQRSFLACYWPVLAGSSLALIAVVAGLVLAFNYLERPADDEIVAASALSTAPATAVAPPLALTQPSSDTPKPATVKFAEPKSSPTAAVAKTLAPSSAVKKDSSGSTVPRLPEAALDDGIGIEIAKDGTKPAGKALPEELPGKLPKCETYGTAINFVRSPLLAAKLAQTEDRLVFTLHVSGNFEDPGFT